MSMSQYPNLIPAPEKNGGRDFILMQAICITWWLYSNGKKTERG